MHLVPWPWHASQRPPLTLKLNRPGFVAADFGFARFGENLADFVEYAGVGRGIAARRAADGALVDLDHLVDFADAVESPCASPALTFEP